MHMHRHPATCSAILETAQQSKSCRHSGYQMSDGREAAVGHFHGALLYSLPSPCLASHDEPLSVVSCIHFRSILHLILLQNNCGDACLYVLS